jgi:hypothetical protein
MRSQARHAQCRSDAYQHASVRGAGHLSCRHTPLVMRVLVGVLYVASFSYGRAGAPVLATTNSRRLSFFCLFFCLGPQGSTHLGHPLFSLLHSTMPHPRPPPTQAPKSKLEMRKSSDDTWAHNVLRVWYLLWAALCIYLIQTRRLGMQSIEDSPLVLRLLIGACMGLLFGSIVGILIWLMADAATS